MIRVRINHVTAIAPQASFSLEQIQDTDDGPTLAVEGLMKGSTFSQNKKNQPCIAKVEGW